MLGKRIRVVADVWWMHTNIKGLEGFIVGYEPDFLSNMFEYVVAFDVEGLCKGNVPMDDFEFELID